MGFLPLFGYVMRASDGTGGKAFSFGGVLSRTALIAALSFTDMAAQAWWAVSEGDVSYDPWWAGLLGWSSYDFNAAGVATSVCGLSVIPGLLLFIVGLTLKQVRWVFLTSMVLLLGGISRMLGVGIGRTILFVQVRDGLIPADAVRSGTNHVDLSSSAVVADSWPALAASALFAVAALAFALSSYKEEKAASSLRLGGNVAVSAALLVVLPMGRGALPATPLLIIAALFIAFLWMPGEVWAAHACETNRVGMEWQWHAASLIWLETLTAFMGVAFGALGI